MPTPPLSLGTMLDLAIVVLGFGSIVFIHELGHYLAARWAGIRVLAFALGIGPALCSYRKGMGWRVGSSEPAYRELERDGRARAAGISPTEYRLNWLPFGGYVKMLGQEDLNPGATSAANDSYQNAKVWKRMVVISAGVVMNVILAAILFVIVFMVGLKTEPPVIGRVGAGSPAALAQADNAKELGVSEPGLLPGDEVIQIDGKLPREFSDLTLATAMSKRGEGVELLIRRAGVDGTLRFRVVPEPSRLSNLLEIGVEPPRSATIITDKTPKGGEEIREVLARLGLGSVRPGMTLTRAGTIAAPTQQADVDRAARASNGQPVELIFTDAQGVQASGAITPLPALERALAPMPGGGVTPAEHLLGLLPVMMVAAAEEDEIESRRGFDQGLRTGDVFARIGAFEFPSLPQGMAEIRAHKGRPLKIAVLRAGELGTPERVELTVQVTSAGTIGFRAGDTLDVEPIIAAPRTDLLPVRGAKGKEGNASSSTAAEASGAMAPLAPSSLGLLTPGTRIDFVAGRPVGNLRNVREALREATRADFLNGQGSSVTLAVALPTAAGAGHEASDRSVEWAITADEVRTLHELGWESPMPAGLFAPQEFLLKARDPVDALRLGLDKTHAVMMNTYLTFVRLFQRTVKVEHLKGPVGIAHLGTIMADRGFIWLLFFCGLISVNLAVVNFLPLPIVDGGQFLLLLAEGIRGKPAPIALQNGLTLAGLVLIGSMFIIVTFNDIKNLLGM